MALGQFPPQEQTQKEILPFSLISFSQTVHEGCAHSYAVLTIEKAEVVTESDKVEYSNLLVGE